MRSASHPNGMPPQSWRPIMSTRQLMEILENSARNPPPMGAAPPAMRAWAEGISSHMPLAEPVKIVPSRFGFCPGDLVLPEGGDAARLIIYYHGGGFFLFS